MCSLPEICFRVWKVVFYKKICFATFWKSEIFPVPVLGYLLTTIGQSLTGRSHHMETIYIWSNNVMKEKKTPHLHLFLSFFGSLLLDNIFHHPVCICLCSDTQNVIYLSTLTTSTVDLLLLPLWPNFQLLPWWKKTNKECSLVAAVYLSSASFALLSFLSSDFLLITEYASYLHTCAMHR